MAGNAEESVQCGSPLHTRFGLRAPWAGALQELENKSPKNDKGYRPNKFHQWLTEEIGDPMLAQHMHTLVMFQRWHFERTRLASLREDGIDQALPKRGTTLKSCSWQT